MTKEPVAFDALVNLIYEAALDSSRWLEFLVEICGQLNSHTGLIWANDFNARSIDSGLVGQDVFIQTGFTDSALASLSAYYAKRNVWLEDPRLHKEGRVVNGPMLFPSNHLKKTEFWTDWLRHEQIFHTCAAIVEKKQDRSVNVTMCRPESMGEYTADELTLLNRLMPHLQAGFALHRRLYRLQALSQAATGVLEQIPFGAVLLDHQGHVLYFNQRAENMAKLPRVLHLRDGSPVRCLHSGDELALAGLIHGATHTGTRIKNKVSLASRSVAPAGGLRISGQDGRQLQLLVAPLPSWSNPFGTRSAAVIFISDPHAAPGNMSDLLRSVYGMTPAESRLTEALVNGGTPQELAETFNVTINTVRTLIKRAAAKAGVSRQSDLVRAVLTGPAVLGNPAALPASPLPR